MDCLIRASRNSKSSKASYPRFQVSSASHFLQSYLQQSVASNHVAVMWDKALTHFRCDGPLSQTCLQKSRLTDSPGGLPRGNKPWASQVFHTASHAVSSMSHLLEKVCCRYPSPGPDSVMAALAACPAPDTRRHRRTVWSVPPSRHLPRKASDKVQWLD